MPALVVKRHRVLRIKIPAYETCEKCKNRFKLFDDVHEDYFGLCNDCINEIKLYKLHRCSRCYEYKLLKQFSKVCVDC